MSITMQPFQKDSTIVYSEMALPTELEILASGVLRNRHTILINGAANLVKTLVLKPAHSALMLVLTL
eukprot:1766519-Amphidinium_carterae.1